MMRQVRSTVDEVIGEQKRDRVEEDRCDRDRDE